MENFEDYENKSYEEARRVTYSFSDHLQYFLNFIGMFIKISIIAFVELFENLVKWLQSSKPKNISGQIALVTGGANGLGRAIAFRLAQENCKVVIVDLNHVEAKRTATEIAEKFNVPTAAYKVDVSNYDAIQQLKIDVESTFGHVDILVNNAGILSAISLREGQPKDIQKVIDVNLTSHFWTVRTFLGKMIENKRGHIIAIASLGAKVSFPLACAYCATKFGVKGFMNALFDELCVTNDDKYVKTSTVYPGFISTRKELSDILDQTKEFSPRMTPKYVANAIVEGMLANKHDITIPPAAKMLQILNHLPARALKYAKTKVVPVNHLKNALSRQ